MKIYIEINDELVKCKVVRDLDTEVEVRIKKWDETFIIPKTKLIFKWRKHE